MFGIVEGKDLPITLYRQDLSEEEIEEEVERAASFESSEDQESENTGDTE